MITRRKSRMISAALTTTDSGSKGRGRYTFDSGTSSGGSGGLKVPTGQTLSFAAGSLIEFLRKNDRIQGPGLIQLNGTACRPIELRPHIDNPDGFFGGIWPAKANSFFEMTLPDDGDFIVRFCRFLSCRKDQAYNDGHIGKNGGAIAAYRPENLIIEDSLFQNCQVDVNFPLGGAIYINSLNPSLDPPGTDWTLSRCKFRDCSSAFLTGGFYLSHHSAGEQIIDCDFLRCDSTASVVSTANTTNNTMSYDASAVNTERPPSGTQCRFTTNGTLPAPLQPDTIYYVTNSVKNVSVQLCSTRDDAIAATNIIDLTDTGSGTHNIFLYIDVGVFEEDDLELVYT